MTPRELRTSIIKLALQGKLVPQIDSEGTGQELLKIIEQNRAVKRTSVPKFRRPIADEDTLLFDIPDTWCWVRLCDIVEFSMGKTPARGEPAFWGSGFPWVSIADMIPDGYISVTKEQVTEKAKKEVFGNISPAGTLLMSFKLTVGRVSILETDAFHNEAIISIFPFADSTFDMRNYLFRVLPIVSTYGDMKSAIKGATLNKESISNLLIPLPPLAEQRRIVEKLEKLMPLVDEYERTWNLTQALNDSFPLSLEKSLIQYAIKGQLVGQNPLEGSAQSVLESVAREKRILESQHKIKKMRSFSPIGEEDIPFEIPDSWVWCRFGEISSYLETKDKVLADEICPNDWSLDLEDIEKESGQILRFCKSKDRKIAGEKTRFNKGQILYSKLRPYLKKILVAPDDGVCTPELIPFDMYGAIDPYYIVYVLKSPYVDDLINSVTYGVKMPRVGTDTMANLLIPIPPLSEQKRIVARLNEILPLCGALNQLGC